MKLLNVLKSGTFWTWTAVAVLTLIVVYAKPGRSECFATAEQARHEHHATYAAWSKHIPHHRNEKCWYVPGWRDRHNEPAIVAAALPPVPLPPLKPPALRSVEVPDAYAESDSVESAHAAVAQRPPTVDLSAYLPGSRRGALPGAVISSPWVTAALSAWLRVSQENAQIFRARVLQSPPPPAAL